MAQSSARILMSAISLSPSKGAWKLTLVKLKMMSPRATTVNILVNIFILKQIQKEL